MTKKDIQQGVRVAIPAARSGNESAIFYLKALLENWHYPYPYLAIMEPYASDDNARLKMVGDFPGFCVESFNVKDLAIYQPTPSLGGAPTI